MNINSLSSGMSMPPPPPKGGESSLTEDQLTLLSETLSEYDVDNLSESDAQSIIATLSDAGIEPGAGLETAMSDLGFDAKSVGELGGADRPPPPPPPSGEFDSGDSEIASEMIDFLSELLSEKLESSEQSTSSTTSTSSTDLYQRAQQELTDEDKQDVYAQLMEKFGLPEGETLIDISV